MEIFTLDQKYTLKIDDLEFEMQPLDLAHRCDAFAAQMVEGNVVENRFRMSAKIIKHSVKAIKGLTTPNGKDYKLSFDDDGSFQLYPSCLPCNGHAIPLSLGILICRL